MRICNQAAEIVECVADHIADFELRFCATPKSITCTYNSYDNGALGLRNLGQPVRMQRLSRCKSARLSFAVIWQTGRFVICPYPLPYTQLFCQSSSQIWKPVQTLNFRHCLYTLVSLSRLATLDDSCNSFLKNAPG